MFKPQGNTFLFTNIHTFPHRNTANKSNKQFHKQSGTHFVTDTTPAASFGGNGSDDGSPHTVAINNRRLLEQHASQIYDTTIQTIIYRRSRELNRYGLV